MQQHQQHPRHHQRDHQAHRQRHVPERPLGVREGEHHGRQCPTAVLRRARAACRIRTPESLILATPESSSVWPLIASTAPTAVSACPAMRFASTRIVTTMITATTTTSAPSPSPMYHEVVSAAISNPLPLRSVKAASNQNPTGILHLTPSGLTGVEPQSSARFPENSLIMPSVTAEITPSPICAALPVTLMTECSDTSVPSPCSLSSIVTLASALPWPPASFACAVITALWAASSFSTISAGPE